ncbi:MAG: LysR family transcriptional regulator [Pseudonocardia sp.]
MDVRHLRLFVAVAEEGSIHAGARRLQMAQPPVSQTLRRLEREAGGALLIRSSRGVQLTEAGTALLEHARDILARVDSAVESVRRVARTERYPLRVGLMAGLVAAAELTWPIISTFQRRHPEVVLQVRELPFDVQFESLATGAVDVAIIRGPCLDERIETEALFTEPRLLCCSAEHPVADADSLAVADVLDYPMIEMVRTPAPFREFWQLNESRGGPPPRPYADPAVSLLEIQLSLLCEPVVMPVAASAWRLGMTSPLLRAIPLTDVPPSDVAVGYLRRGSCAHAREFARCAREVSHRSIDLVPGAVTSG